MNSPTRERDNSHSNNSRSSNIPSAILPRSTSALSENTPRPIITTNQSPIQITPTRENYNYAQLQFMYQESQQKVKQLET